MSPGNFPKNGIRGPHAIQVPAANNKIPPIMNVFAMKSKVRRLIIEQRRTRGLASETSGDRHAHHGYDPGDAPRAPDDNRSDGAQAPIRAGTRVGHPSNIHRGPHNEDGARDAHPIQRR